MAILNLPIPPEVKVIFLDNGGTSFPKPPETYEKMDSFYRSAGVNPGKSGFKLCIEAGSLVSETRELLCEFFGGSDPNRLTFSHNSTDSLNLAISGTILPGDHVVTTQLEHNATLRPVWKLESLGCSVDWVDFDRDGYVDPQEMIKRLRKDTKAVVMNHASNVIGTVQDVATVFRTCRERGIISILDASQTAGVLPVRMDDLCADIICFTGHKSLMGPMGMGGMYVREGVEIAHTRAGGTGAKSFQRSHLEEYPYRMEYGTPNLPGIAGLNAGVRWINRIGIDAIHKHEMALWRILRDGLAEIEGVKLYCSRDVPGKCRVSVLPFTIDGMDVASVGSILDVNYNIACRAGLHCAPIVHERLGTDKIGGAVRFGIGAFNNEDHIKTAIRAVADIAEAHLKGHK